MIKLNKKNLVISTVGDNSLHRNWNTKDADFDVCLIYFGENEGYFGESKYYKKEKGYKYHLLQNYLNENPWFTKYDYIWLPDDDIFMETNDVNKLFKFMSDYDLWLSQPSIIGHYGVKITLHQMGSLIRFTNWVEIMCPCFSSKALNICKQSFKENNTGWSIETIWNSLLGHPKDKIAIIDDVIAIHTRATCKGETYNNPINAMQEAVDVYYKWGLDKEMEKDIIDGKPTGGEVYCSVVYKQLFKEMEDGIEKSARFWPDCFLLKNKIEDIKIKQ